MAVVDEKSILIRVRKVSSSKILDYSGTDGSDALRVFPPRWSRCLNPDPDPAPKDSGPYENAWLIIEPAADSGFKISQISEDHDQSPLRRARAPASSLMIGSSLYEIDPLNCDSGLVEGSIRCLDIGNQSAGWKSCCSVNFIFDKGDRAAAVHQYIYVIGTWTEKCDGDRFGYVFDTIMQQGYFIDDPPSDLQLPQDAPDEERYWYEKEVVWAPLESRGLLVTFPRINGNFYLHDPVLRRWKLCKNYEPLPLDCFFRVPQKYIPPPNYYTGVFSVLNGILYICNNDYHKDPIFDLYAYDCKQGKLLYSVKLPVLCNNSWAIDDAEDILFIPDHMVAISDSRLCLIWKTLSRLFCADISVSTGTTTPSVKLRGVQCFKNLFVQEIINCMHMDASLGQIAKNSAPLLKTRLDHKQSKEKLRVELSGNGRKTAPLKCSQKSMNPLGMFPFSKRMLYRPLMKKVKREPREMVHRLSRLKLSPKPMNLPSVHQSSDGTMRIISFSKEMKLKRHQGVKCWGDDLSEG